MREREREREREKGGERGREGERGGGRERERERESERQTGRIGKVFIMGVEDAEEVVMGEIRWGKWWLWGIEDGRRY